MDREYSNSQIMKSTKVSLGMESKFFIYIKNKQIHISYYN